MNENFDREWRTSAARYTTAIKCTLHDGYQPHTTRQLSAAHYTTAISCTLHDGYQLHTTRQLSAAHYTTAISCTLHDSYQLHTTLQLSAAHYTSAISCTLHYSYEFWTPLWNTFFGIYRKWWGRFSRKVNIFGGRVYSKGHFGEKVTWLYVWRLPYRTVWIRRYKCIVNVHRERQNYLRVISVEFKFKVWKPTLISRNLEAKLLKSHRQPQRTSHIVWEDCVPLLYVVNSVVLVINCVVLLLIVLFLLTVLLLLCCSVINLLFLLIVLLLLLIVMFYY